MPVVINGSTGISGTDGSASTPAVQGTDTNTGLFFPAADTIAFAEGGTEVMRIDSAGNVGVGTTTPAKKFVVSNAGAVGMEWSPTDYTGNMRQLAYNRSTTAYVALRTEASQHEFYIGGNERMLIDPSGNVGIGTSAPTQRLSVDGNATFTGTAVMASSFLRNRIINGQQQVDQRNAGASASVASGAAVYTTDRNGVYNGGPNTITVQRVTGAAGFQNALRITGSASNVGVSWFHRIEAGNSFDLAGVSVTFSAWVWASTSRNVTPSISTPNSFENFASQTTGGSTTWAVTTTPTRFLWTFTMPANAVNGAEIAIALGVLLAGETVTLTGAQLEAGSVATPFERRQFGQELALCQRYYEVMPDVNYRAYGTTSDALIFPVSYKQTKRATPTNTATVILSANMSFNSIRTTTQTYSPVVNISSTGVGEIYLTITSSAEL